MTEVENQTLNLLKNIIENRDKIFESINEAKEKLIPIVNIINILGNTYYEVSNSSLLYNILKIKFKYDNKEINFAKDFSEYIIKEKLGNDSVNINSSNINVYREERPSIESKSRMDLFINSNNFEIIIENKIGAGDQPNQLKDYYENRIKNNDKIKDNIFVVYLTRYGYKPSGVSIKEDERKKLEDDNKICYLSHDDMANWIEDKILNNKEYEFLKEKEFQLIYSALIQIAYNEKIISKETEENKMEINKIKECVDFDLLLKGINDNDLDKKVNELNKFYDLLENSKKIILNKRFELVSDDIKYSLEVSEFIKNIKSNQDGNYMKDATFCDEKFIRNYFCNYIENNHLQNIIIPIKNFGRGLCITLEQRIDFISWYFPLLIGIYSNNKILKDKLLEKHLKEIEYILVYNENKELVDNDNKDKYIKSPDDEYICCLYIDTKKDEAKDIAYKIIKLYEFLRDNIKLDNA